MRTVSIGWTKSLRRNLIAGYLRGHCAGLAKSSFRSRNFDPGWRNSLITFPRGATGNRGAEPAFVFSYCVDFPEDFTALTSISTNAHGAAKAATCMALRAGLLGWSLVPKNRV